MAVHGSAWRCVDTLGSIFMEDKQEVFTAKVKDLVKPQSSAELQGLDLLGIQTSAFPGLGQRPTGNITVTKTMPFLRSCERTVKVTGI